MRFDLQTAAVSKKMLWAGRIISALPTLFLLLDGIMKLFKPKFVIDATVQLGYQESVISALGIVLTTWGAIPPGYSTRDLLSSKRRCGDGRDAYDHAEAEIDDQRGEDARLSGP